MPDQKPRQFRIYRTNKDNNGVASAWELSYKEDKKYDNWEMFLTVAKQSGSDDNGNASYDWKGSQITVKLGDNDIAELLAVLSGRKDALGFKGSLFHQTPNGGNKAVKMDYVDGVFKFSVSAQNTNKETTGPYYQTISAAEGCVLEVLLKKAVERMYGW